MKKIKLILSGLIIIGLTSLPLTSCDSTLDVNDNPNYPTEATLATLLPSASAFTISQFGLNGTLIGTMWLQHTTQGNSTNQYNTLVNYNLTDASYNAIWTNAYANALPDLKLIIERSETENAWNYWVIAKVLMAYNYHMLTDLYGDIPFTEALQASVYPKPHYDDSKTVIYPGLLAMLDEAIAKETDAKSNANPVLTSQDMFFNGEISKWISFAKSLKLKIMMRDFEANKTQIQSLLASGNLLDGNCAMTSFEDATNKGNPFYEYNIRQLNTTENVRACHTLSEFLLANNDPRIENIYELTANATALIAEGKTLTYAEKYEGIGSGARPETSGANSLPLANSSKFKQSYNDPVYLMNNSEIKFLIAEAYARLGDKAQAKLYYEAGVTNSFDRWTESSGKAAPFLAAGGSYAFDSSSLSAMLNCIMIQKWVSFARANALDGVFDRNRTGIPSIDSEHTVRLSQSDRSKGLTSGYVLGTLVAPESTVLDVTEYPRRLLVPKASSQYNENAPTTKLITEKLWWQITD